MINKRIRLKEPVGMKIKTIKEFHLDCKIKINRIKAKGSSMSDI